MLHYLILHYFDIKLFDFHYLMLHYFNVQLFNNALVAVALNWLLHWFLLH